VFVPPGLRQAPVLDLMCSHFVLTLAARQGQRFNVRRDLNTLLALAGRHLIWPMTVLTRCASSWPAAARTTSSGAARPAVTAAFMERYGVWRGPYEEGTLFFYLDEYAKESPKDLLSVLAVTGDWLSQALKKQSTLVEKNIDALANLLQLNRAERALLLYGTLARYQRDLRSILVEFKVNNAPEAYAAIADVAGVKASEVGEALRAGSRLERIGMVENLISEHNITDLADLMKVSEKLPPVLMREYRSQSELMAVFTRPAARSALTPGLRLRADDVRLLSGLLREAVARKEPGVNVLLYGPPGTGKTELARVVAQAAGLELFEVEYADRDGNALSGPRPLPLAADRAGVPQGHGAFGAAVRRGGRRVPADLQRGGAVHGARRAGAGAAQRQRQRQGLGQPDPGIQRGAHALGDQPHRADRPGLPPPLRLPPGTQEPAARRARAAGAQDAGRRAGVRGAGGAPDRRKGLTPAQIRTAVRFAHLAAAPAKTPGRRKKVAADTGRRWTS
jgi:hypothetical protein